MYSIHSHLFQFSLFFVFTLTPSAGLPLVLVLRLAALELPALLVLLAMLATTLASSIAGMVGRPE